MVEGEHRVGLATAEARLNLDDGIAAGAREPLQGSNQEATDALGDVGPPEEVLRIPVLVAAFAAVDLRQVRHKLRLLITAGRHVRVGRDDLAPRLQARRRLAFNGGRGRLPYLALRILLVAKAHHLLALSLHLDRLRSGNGLEQALRAVEGTIRVVGRERLVVRPAVADVAQLADERPLRLAQLALEDLLPVEPDRVEQSQWIHQRIATARRAVLAEIGDIRPLRPMDRMKLALDERLEPVAQQLDGPADSLLIRKCHSIHSRHQHAHGVAFGR